jgi:hypothetical protein
MPHHRRSRGGIEPSAAAAVNPHRHRRSVPVAHTGESSGSWECGTALAQERTPLHRRQFLAVLAPPPRQYAQPWSELVAAKSPVKTPLLGLLFTRQRVGALGLRDWGVCARFSHLAGEGAPRARRRRRPPGRDWGERLWPLDL